jgi:hypothetical protein
MELGTMPRFALGGLGTFIFRIGWKGIFEKAKTPWANV